MIGTVVRVGFLRLRHDKVEVMLTFVLPIAFFTIFAFIFDDQIGLGKSPRVDLALVDEDGTELSRQLLDVVSQHQTLRILTTNESNGSRAFTGVEPVRELVERGGLPVAVVVPRGWARSVTRGGEDDARIRLFSDASDPVATQVVSSLIQQVGNQLLAERAKRDVQDLFLVSELMREEPRSFEVQLAAAARASFPEPVEVDVVDVLASGKANPAVSMYAAGIAVMFMLFGAVGNAGSLLDEEENQTLERLMCSELGMTELIAGKWLLVTIVGIAQVTLMFCWAQLAFGVDFLGNLPGFLVMTVVTAAAASSLALALAASCRSRAQLNALAIILVLAMSALGGSMVPRYVMSESMQAIGRATFNAWALDGYMKVFWRGLPVGELATEATVLAAVSIALLIAARLLARRWESL